MFPNQTESWLSRLIFTSSHPNKVRFQAQARFQVQVQVLFQVQGRFQVQFQAQLRA